MKYKFETEVKNYEDYASGRVLYNVPGATAFPVRLASEMIQRCFHRLAAKGLQAPYRIYDPCCGGAYMLTTVAFLFGERLDRIYASDIDHNMVEAAGNNLSLLTEEGLRKRERQIRQLHEEHQKNSHLEALDSLQKLQNRGDFFVPADIEVFQHDITSAPPSSLSLVDIVMTDLPYGSLTQWKSICENPAEAFFNHIEPLLHANSVIAVAADKSQRLAHDNFKRVEYFKIGKRHAGLFEPL